MSSVSEILRSLADERALALLKAVARTNLDSDFLVRDLKLSRKEYYSRMTKLLKAGLVKRQKGKYSLTMFGKLIYGMAAHIEDATNNSWKLKAIDNLEMVAEVPDHERNKIIDSLLDDDALKNLLFSVKFDKPKEYVEP